MREAWRSLLYGSSGSETPREAVVPRRTSFGAEQYQYMSLLAARRGVDLERLAARGHGFVASEEASERGAQLAVSVGVVGLEPYGLTVLHDRLVESPLARQRPPQVEARIEPVAVDAHRFLVVRE